MSVERRSPAPAAALLGVVLALLSTLSACKEVEEVAPAVHQPAVVEELEGLDVKRVRFDREGARQVDLRTATVAEVGRQTVVPYAALIYDAQGVSWVYVARGPLSYQRQEVVVDRIEGRRVWLRDGPRVGAQVVTRGATEVYGAELDIAGSH